MPYTDIYTTEEFNEILEKEEAALFYLSSPSCNVCRVLKPKVAEMIQEHFPKIKLFYADVEKSPLISGQLRVFTIPSLLIYLDGKEVIRKSRNLGIEELKIELQRPYSLMFE